MTTTPTLREAAQQALEALAPLANATTPAEREALTDADAQAADAASCDLRAAMAEQAAEQAEPGSWRSVGSDDGMRHPEACDLVGGETDMPAKRDTPSLREALHELVALKDMKDAIDKGPGPRAIEANLFHRLKDDYARRKPLAWAAARAALAAPEQAAMLASAPPAPAAEQAEPVRRPKLIGWRTENFLHETSDREVAKTWEPHIGVLPIFEGDPNTSLLPNNSIGGGNG